MPRLNAAAPDADALPFRFIGGEPCLDFVNTVDWTAAGPDRERLTSYPRLLAWAAESGVVGRAEARALKHRAAARRGEAAAALESARSTRTLLHRAFNAAARREPVAAALAALAAPLADALGQLRLGAGPEARARWRWHDAGQRLDAPLWPVVWSAARLLAGDEAGAIRICAGPDCGWVYVDRSRNRLRRWCEMSTCGTRAKSERRAGRRRR